MERFPPCNAWWAAISGIAKSRTRLKWLSSSSSNTSKSTKTALWGEPPKNWKRVAEGGRWLPPQPRAIREAGLHVPCHFTRCGQVIAVAGGSGAKRCCVPSKPRQGRGPLCTIPSLLGVWHREDVTSEALSWRRRDQDAGNPESPKFTQSRAPSESGTAIFNFTCVKDTILLSLAPTRFLLFFSQSLMFS